MLDNAPHIEVGDANLDAAISTRNVGNDCYADGILDRDALHVCILEAYEQTCG